MITWRYVSPQVRVRYAFACAVTILAMLCQFWVLHLRESIALMADTFHVTSDVLGLSAMTLVLWSTIRVLRSRSFERSLTYVNGLLLVLGALVAMVEAYQHTGSHLPRDSIVLLGATIGLIANVCTLILLKSVPLLLVPQGLRNNHQINLSHVKLDLYASFVVIISGVAIRFGVTQVDRFLGIGIAVYILIEGIGHMYQEWTGKPSPIHLHGSGGDGHQHRHTP